MLKNPHPGSIPGSGRSPREGNGNPLSSILAWEIPWTEESMRLQKSQTQLIDVPAKPSIIRAFILNGY